MKTSVCFTCALLLAASLAWTADPAPPAKTDPPPAKTDPSKALPTVRDKVSYSFGFQQGNHLAQQKIDLNLTAYAIGMADAFAAREPQLTEAQMREAFEAFQTEMMEKKFPLSDKDKATAEKNQAAAEAWLAENKKKEGVKTLPSGLQYKVLKEGTGPIPNATDTVTADYEGRLIDGTVFDSSYKRGEPTKFPVTGVIKGWTEALLLMKVGSKWELYIPPNLAYGKHPPTEKIPLNSVLIFTLDLKATGPELAPR